MDFQNLKADSSEALNRIKARQLTELVREPIAAKIAASIDPNDDGMKNKILAAFNTEAGEGVFKLLLSLLINAVPLENEMITGIAKEIRVQGMTTVGDEIMDVVMGPLREVLTTFVAGQNDLSFKVKPAIEAGTKTPETKMLVENIEAKVKVK